jgi:hypothetical protein
LSAIRARTRSMRAECEISSNEATTHYPSRGVASLGAGDPAPAPVRGADPRGARWNAPQRGVGVAGGAG